MNQNISEKLEDFTKEISFCSKLYRNKFSFVYILKCWNDEKEPFYYIGQTRNLFRRLSQHNFRKNQTLRTKEYQNKDLVYFEFYTNNKQGLFREKELIKMPLERRLSLIGTMDKHILGDVKAILNIKKGSLIQYHYYDSNKRSFINMPRQNIEKNSMDWQNGDKIGIINLNKDGIDGFFIWKREEKKE